MCGSVFADLPVNICSYNTILYSSKRRSALGSKGGKIVIVGEEKQSRLLVQFGLCTHRNRRQVFR